MATLLGLIGRFYFGGWVQAGLCKNRKAMTQSVHCCSENCFSIFSIIIEFFQSLFSSRLKVNKLHIFDATSAGNIKVNYISTLKLIFLLSCGNAATCRKVTDRSAHSPAEQKLTK